MKLIPTVTSCSFTKSKFDITECCSSNGASNSKFSFDRSLTLFLYAGWLTMVLL
jgi:hypothetical protein